MIEAKRFQGKVAIITGGAQGIGRAICLRMAEGGAAICIADRHLQESRNVSEQIRVSGGKASPVLIDVSDVNCGEELVAEAVACYGQVDLAVICAGMADMKPWTEIQPQEWNQMMDVNLRGAFLCLKAIGKQMMTQGRGGAIVNLTATSGHGPRPDAAHYGASKAGLIHLTRSLALGLAPHKVRVNAISPGIVKTQMWEQVVKNRANLQGLSVEQYERQALSNVPLGRAAEPDEVASLASFLLSEEASYITGQIVVLDGGYSLKVA